LTHLAASEADRRTASGEIELIRDRHAFEIYELFHRLPVRRPIPPVIAFATAPGRDAHLLTLGADLAIGQHGG